MREENGPAAATVRLDARQLKSRQKIVAALSELLIYRRIEEISVRELTEKAQVTRTTFYAHYGDINEILLVWIEGWIREVRDKFDAYEHMSELEPIERLRLFILFLLRLIEEDGAIIPHVLSGRAGDGALETLRNGLIEMISIRNNNVGPRRMREAEIKLLGIFYGGALLNLLDCKFRKELTIGDEEFAEFFVRTTHHGVGHLLG